MQVEFSTPPAPSHCEHIQMERADPAAMHHSPAAPPRIRSGRTVTARPSKDQSLMTRPSTPKETP
mgnify:FL=1